MSAVQAILARGDERWAGHRMGVSLGGVFQEWTESFGSVSGTTP